MDLLDYITTDKAIWDIAMSRISILTHEFNIEDLIHDIEFCTEILHPTGKFKLKEIENPKFY